jgi:CO dehydrogenase/acetyl-CoA synthase beta subunit
MGLFDQQYDQIKGFLNQKIPEGQVSEFFHREKLTWQNEKHRNLVLGPDTAVELGNPKDASTSFLIWINNPGRVKNGRMTLIGPDLPLLNNRKVSFGKIVIVGGDDFNEDNACIRYREMELLRYDIHLKGYMMRGVSQYLREWSRVSKEAIKNGFSFKILGGAIIDAFSALTYVKSAEVIFITSCKADVITMQSIANGVIRRISAINKMVEEMDFDCDTCEYTDVCGDVAELRTMRKKLTRRKGVAHASG